MSKESKVIKSKKICFLITPIGSENSPVRERVDQWMELIYQKALGDKYRIVRADQIAAPGMITEQIIEYVTTADLVVIDYTGLNSNVMYEAAIRHISEKPFIQIHELGTALPFDINNLRSIPYNSKDLDYPSRLVKDLKNTLKEISSPAYQQIKFVKEKFDFQKIVSDPVKFVSLLTKHITSPKSSEDSIVSVIDDPYAYMGSSSVLGYGRKKIICPKCKAIKYEDSGPLSTAYEVQLGGIFGKKHYRCNICGTEFE